MLAAEEIRRAVGTLDGLPTVPGVYAELRRALADERASVADVAAIVGKDPALAARVLQIVSSPYFRRGAPIASIERAIAAVGLRPLQALVLSAAAFGRAEASSLPPGLDLEALRRRGLQGAAIARKIAAAKPCDARVSGTRGRGDEAFLAALLVDVGMLALAAVAPARLAEALAEAQRRGERLERVELELYGTTHAHVGAYLLGIWGLPFPVCEAVARHHEPLPAETGGALLWAITSVATSLASGEPPDPGASRFFADADLAQARALA
jgi:HD-like signal output (HDOD) protein